MTGKEILQIALRQSAVDCCCAPEDFLSSGSAQTRALLTFALSGEKSIQYPIAADGEKFTLRVEKSDNFSVVSSEKNYAASALSGLPLCAVSGLLLSIS